MTEEKKARIMPHPRQYAAIIEEFADYPIKTRLFQNELAAKIEQFENYPFCENGQPCKKRTVILHSVKKEITLFNMEIVAKEKAERLRIQQLELQQLELQQQGRLEENTNSESFEILKNPNLFNLITEVEFDKKIVGEIETRKVIFLCAQGRLVENSQIASYNLLVNDEAGTGKDYITYAVLEILPSESFIHKTRISPAVFTYWHNQKFEPGWTWNGKVFYPEDISEVVLNSDVFKVMTSKGSSAVITIKNQAFEIDIQGKPVVVTTTASAVPNPELVRRFVILNLDGSEKQTEAIKKRQSENAKFGVISDYDPIYTEAMKLLKRVKVKIPFADLIDKHFPSKNVIMRTHYQRFLDFIKASTAFHQYQRDKDIDGYLIANGQDYDIAKECFIKLSSNKYMIPLTINQKKILAKFEDDPTYFGSASVLHANKMNFLTLAALQTNLGLLVKYGILETRGELDSLNRQIEIYSLSKSYEPSKKINLPTYKELQVN